MRARSCSLAALATAVSFAACDCRSDVERCNDAQVAAESAWQAYASLLKRELEDARSVAADTKSALAAVELRLAEPLKHDIDLRHDRWDPAWLRAYDAALVLACRRDETCKALREKEAAAKRRTDDAMPRLDATTRAAETTRIDPAQAEKAAAEIELDPARPALAAAKQATHLAAVECEGVAMPKR